MINLLQDLQEKLGLTYLFVADDLSVVRHISNRIAVMYLGRIVEIADAGTLYDDPRHFHTKALLSEMPIPDSYVEEHRSRFMLRGEVPAHSTHRRAVASTRAARTAVRSARPRCQNFGR